MDSDIFTCFINHFNRDETVKVIFSRSNTGYEKITVRPVIIKDEKKWQIEKFHDGKAFHVNLQYEELIPEINQKILGSFGQINIINMNSSVQILISKKGKISISTERTKEAVQNLTHDKEKKYIFNEGDNIAPLRELGVFTLDNKIIKAHYAKYKQINRFMELIDDELKVYDKDEIRIIEYGCGKSFLTFLIYHYFKYIKNIDITIFGYDLKKEIVEECDKIAEKYGYAGLRFINADIAGRHEMNYKADMIVTLHACDTATDYALYNAIKNNVKYIFSVPCCQHEINSQIKSSDESRLLLNDGLIKERFSALLTDSIRCEVLRQEGYEVDVIEFVDSSHTPKNLLIRAKLNKGKKSDYEDIGAILKQFNCGQKLFSLITGIER